MDRHFKELTPEQAEIFLKGIEGANDEIMGDPLDFLICCGICCIPGFSTILGLGYLLSGQHKAALLCLVTLLLGFLLAFAYSPITIRKDQERRAKKEGK